MMKKTDAPAGSAHSPLPWTYRAGSGTVHRNDGVSGDVVARYVDQANAEFICRAVNNFDELLAALKAANQFIANGIELGFIRMPDPCSNDPALRTPDMVAAAIAKAEWR